MSQSSNMPKSTWLMPPFEVVHGNHYYFTGVLLLSHGAFGDGCLSCKCSFELKHVLSVLTFTYIWVQMIH